MAVTVLAAWLVGARSPRRRKLGFWVFLLSNVLWIAWGWSARAYALVVLQLALAAMNIRGAKKNEASEADSAGARPDAAPAPDERRAQSARGPQP